ncbi:H/ACA_ribonucleoprotein complex [Hexamita inflata]|uniref:H/ACA ribonucleoprotein complex subunit n=1 Tax=Hexamita inflata TaxID=28002 RepID=A0AA86TSX4_9EUKA|nr:H/ACA ribonucleoprotein complex [Hexamita inflata]CAI9941179.1 H/ACA ribonucleoprotein complex [Hexamita inflata]
MSSVSYSEESGDYEVKDHNNYYNTNPKNQEYNQERSRQFGTVMSVVGNTAVISALPTFDLIGDAQVLCDNQVGQIFDLMGPQFNPLYVARFSSPVNVNSQVFIDISSIQKYSVE